MDSPKSKVLIGVTTMGDIHTQLVTNLIQWAKRFQKDELGFYFTFKVAPVDRARNTIVKFFLEDHYNKQGVKQTPFTHLLFIDSDTLPPIDAVQKLLDMDKDIATGVTPILHYDKEKKVFGTLDNCFTHQDRDKNDNIIKTHAIKRNTGIQKIWRCGGSCMLIKREVFEKLEKPYFKFEYNEEGVEHTRSEDLYFCDQATKAGFEIWCDSGLICNHFKPVML